jgi:hypothetical protein
MRLKRFLLFGVFLAGLLPATALATTLYKWTDENGVVHYSDKLPPDNSKQKHEELNQRGITTREVERAKTEQEILEEKAAEEAEKEEKRRIAEQQARERMRDKILLDTFTTERDLLLTRDDRLNAVDSLINLTEANNQRLQTQRDELETRINAIKNANREVPENTLKQQENLNEQYQSNLGFIATKQQEREAITRQFEADLQRYRELKGLDGGSNEVLLDPAALEKPLDTAAESAAPPPVVSP